MAIANRMYDSPIFVDSRQGRQGRRENQSDIRFLGNPKIVKTIPRRAFYLVDPFAQFSYRRDNVPLDFRSLMRV